MPAGTLDTVPAPVPTALTESANICPDGRLKVAVTDFASSSGWRNVQLPVPAQAPLQPEKTDPAAGVAVSVTSVPVSKTAPQIPDEQSMPVGSLVTVPPPVPATFTVTLWFCNGAL